MSNSTFANIRKNRQRLGVVCVLCVAFTGCASDSKNSGVTDGGGVECSRVATTCPVGCKPVTGSLFVTSCVEAPTTIACFPVELVGSGDVGCIKESASGQLYQLSTGTTYEQYLPTDPHWDLCGEQESIVVSAPACN